MFLVGRTTYNALTGIRIVPSVERSLLSLKRRALTVAATEEERQRQRVAVDQRNHLHTLYRQ